MRRPVAVTAVGIVCGLGRDAASFAEALRAHRSGARRLADPGLAALACGSAVEVQGEVPEVDGFPDDRKVSLLRLAAEQTFLSGLHVPPERRGVFLGTGLSSVTPRELAEDVYRYVGATGLDRDAAALDIAVDRVAPRRHLPERATAWLVDQLNARGPSGTAFSACAAGAEAIAAGARAIARGEADVVWAGGHDAMVHPFGIVSFEVLGALARTVGRPFDRRRDGFLIGEGAAILRLEPLDACESPLAILHGAGSSIDAYGITAPHPEGLGAEAAMRRALRDAGLSTADVDFVKAHATATPVGDVAEAAAIRRVFGGDVPVASIKGAVGHTLAAAGAVESVAVILGLSQGFTFGTVGCDEPDDLGIRVQVRPSDRAPRIVVANSFGFGGQNSSLVWGRV